LIAEFIGRAQHGLACFLARFWRTSETDCRTCGFPTAAPGSPKERILPLAAVANRRRTLYQGGVMIAHRHHSSRFAFIPLDNVRS
jgi:hypothetical protein